MYHLTECELTRLKEEMQKLIDDIDGTDDNQELLKADNPWCDYYPEANAFHIGTIDEGDVYKREYDAHIPFNQVIEEFISDRSVGKSSFMDPSGTNDALLFIKKLRDAADLIESKLGTRKL